MRRLFILAPAFAVLVLIISCKDDAVSTNFGNNPSDSLLFTKDSIYSGPLGFWGEANYIIRDTAIKKVKATFTCVTNDVTDSIVASSFTVFSDSTFGVYIWGYHNNDNFTFSLPVYLSVNDSATVRFAVNAPVTSNKFIIMKDIKLYKTH
jgi:hypothetical protein